MSFDTCNDLRICEIFQYVLNATKICVNNKVQTQGRKCSCSICIISSSTGTLLELMAFLYVVFLKQCVVWCIAVSYVYA